MRRTLAVLAFGLLLATSCGNSSHSAAPSPSPTSTSTVPSGSTPSSAAPSSAAPSPSPACRPASAPPSDTGPESNPPGDIPDDTQFVTYAPPSGRYAIRVPEGWARTAKGDTVTYTDKFNTVRVELVPSAHAPTVTSVRATEVPSVARTATCFALRDVTTVQRRGAGTAVLVTYRADAAPDPVTGKRVRDDVERYEFWHNGTEAVVTLSGAQGADNVDPWRTVSDSFRWT
jgi:hypothetical protein